MSTDIATLGIQIDARPVARARDELGRFTAGARDAEGQTQRLGKATDVLTKLYGDLAKAYAAWKIAEHVKEAALLAARYETMGVVMRVAGNNAGYTNSQMLSLQKQLQATGISMLQSRNALTQLSTANIDLSKATELARTAQNLAVVANMNSSEALEHMIHGIKSGQVEVLKTMGLNVNFENSYKTMAAQLHTTAEKLTEHQKMLARTNVVLKEAASYNGIYEESMSTAGKQLSSLTRYIEDLKVKAGEAFLPVLTDMVKKFTEALKESNKELDKFGTDGTMSKIGEGLKVIFKYVSETVLVMGANILYILDSMGSEIGGLAAQANAVLHGNFAEAGRIHDQMVKDAAARRAAVDKFSDSVLGVKRSTDGATQATKEYTDAQARADMQASMLAQRQEQSRIAAGEANRKAQEQEEKRLQAEEKARKEREKMVEKYKEIIRAVEEKTATEKLDMATTGSLTEGQKYAVRILDDLRTGVLKLTDTEKIRLTQKLTEYLLIEKANAAQEAEKKAYEERVQKNVDSVKALEELNEGLRQEVKNFGLSTQSINLNTIAKYEAQIASGNLDEVETLAAEMKIKLLREQIDLQNQLDRKNKDLEADRLRIEQAKKTEEVIDKTFHDGFVAMLDKGTSAWASWTKSLRTTFKSSVADELYKMFAKPFVMKVVASMGSYFGIPGYGSDTTGGSSGNGLGSTVGMAQTASSLYKMVSGGLGSLGAGFSASLGSGVSAFGNLIGSANVSAFGSGMGMSRGAAQAAAGAYNSAGMSNIGSSISSGSSFGSAAGVAGWIAAGMALSHKLYNQGWDAQNGSISNYGPMAPLNAPMLHLNRALQALGMNNTMANMFSGASTVSRLFGRKNPEIETQGLQGTISTTGFSGERYANILEKGGLFRSDKRYTQTSALEASQKASLDATVQGMIQAVKGFGATLGLEASQIDGYTKAVKLQLTGDAAKDQEALAKLFSEMGDELSTRLAPSIAQFIKSGETAATTLQRLAGEFTATNEVAKTLGMSAEQLFGGMGISSATAREHMIELAGGIDNLSQYATTYAQNFMTEAERLAPVQKAVTEAMTALGYASVTTRDDFKATVDRLVSSGAVLTAEGAKTFASLMAVAGAFATAHPEIDKTADALQKMKDASEGLFNDVDKAYSTLESVVSREKEALQARIDAEQSVVDRLRSLSEALTGTLQAMHAEGRESIERAAAQAQITAALAIARAGGPLPDVNAISDALTTVQQTSTSRFATQEDYMRDFLRTQNDVGELASLTKSQLTDAEKQLAELQAQSDQLDAMLKHAKDQVDQLKGVNTNLLTVTQALEALRGAIVSLQANPYANSVGAITSAYQSALGRSPDSAGMNFWQTQVGNGVPVSNVVGAIQNSTEAQLRGMYQSVLGRTADAGGLNFWMSKAAGGVTLDDIRSAMMQSDEYRGSLRGYANGGDHPGGLRLVGEHGPEVEATGPSRIWSTSKMSQIFGQAEATAIMKELLTEIRQMRVEQRVGDQANVVATKAQTRFLRDLTDDGTALKTKTTT